MDVVRLGELYSDVYKPDELIENYSSMIWTERFQDPGEFELKTPRVKETMALLSEDTLISHLDTRVVMAVDTLSIERDVNGNEELTVMGRSLDSFMEHRFIAGPYGKKRLMARSYYPIGAALVLIWQAINSENGVDVTREGDFVWTEKDYIENSVVTDSVANTADLRRWWVEEGNLYPQLMSILKGDDLALRVLRPGYPVSTNLVHVKAMPLSERGVIERTPITTNNSLQFDVYNGLDRSSEQSDNPIVSFNYVRGHFDKEHYLFSDKDFKTLSKIKTSLIVQDVYRNFAENYVGLQRRVTEYDAGDPELPEEPVRPEDLKSDATPEEREQHAHDMDEWIDAHREWVIKRTEIVTNFKDDVSHDALVALRATRKISMFTGDISQTAPYKYKTHYDLGDFVSLYGRYGEEEKLIVSEHVRTDSSEGDRGFPGLSLPVKDEEV